VYWAVSWFPLVHLKYCTYGTGINKLQRNWKADSDRRRTVGRLVPKSGLIRAFVREERGLL
jgi:hypothetical protein